MSAADTTESLQTIRKATWLPTGKAEAALYHIGFRGLREPSFRRPLEIVVRGKGRMVDHLPLLSDVGEALALYIREDRGVSASRRVFLRTWAPRNALTGPAAVGHMKVVDLHVYRSRPFGRLGDGAVNFLRNARLHSLR